MMQFAMPAGMPAPQMMMQQPVAIEGGPQMPVAMPKAAPAPMVVMGAPPPGPVRMHSGAPLVQPLMQPPLQPQPGMQMLPAPLQGRAAIPAGHQARPQIAAKAQSTAAAFSASGAAPQVLSRPSKQESLHVLIMSASGLQHLNFFGDAPWCQCGVVNRAGQHFVKHSTTQIKGTLEPIWEEGFEIENWQVGDDLIFTVMDKGLLTSHVEGKVTVRCDQFYPTGLEGELPIDGLDHATLYVRIVPDELQKQLVAMEHGQPLPPQQPARQPAPQQTLQTEIIRPANEATVQIQRPRPALQPSRLSEMAIEPQPLRHEVMVVREPPPMQPREEYAGGWQPPPAPSRLVNPDWIQKELQRARREARTATGVTREQMLGTGVGRDLTLPGGEADALRPYGDATRSYSSHDEGRYPLTGVGGQGALRPEVRPLERPQHQQHQASPWGHSHGRIIQPTRHEGGSLQPSTHEVTYHPGGSVLSRLENKAANVLHKVEDTAESALHRAEHAVGFRTAEDAQRSSGQTRTQPVPAAQPAHHATTPAGTIGAAQPVRGDTSHKLDLQSLEVTILQATGLQHLNFCGDSPWVECDVKCSQRNVRPQRIQTKPLSGTLEPVWNETHRIDNWCIGEPLEFVVFDKGLLTSRHEGKAIEVPSDWFYPNGFEGGLVIDGLEHAALFVRIVPEDLARAEQAAQQPEYADAAHDLQVTRPVGGVNQRLAGAGFSVPAADQRGDVAGAINSAADALLQR
eukprot:TRINITY_DN47351_c0_g1_i1.p1 TRINITY_DN47351_c0_g1~~TRINITY_DN47351_c0_g1_i1.p1  ORF type:complete len:740 (-),score=133.14 TRINITY_DN47351_c0_g1_i1:70-2289(-)